jgi:ABC-type nitrate/sulfonate/bicarbonate transport system substrate-binding protein
VKKNVRVGPATAHKLLRPALATSMLALSLLGSGVATDEASASTGTGLVSAKECASNEAAGTITWASSFAFAGAATIMDVFAAQSLGYFKDMCLTVKFVTSSYTPLSLVSTGAAQVTGEGSAADYLLAAANGTNLRAVSTDGDASDYAVLTQSGITSLKQLAGKTFAYHETVPVAISEMLDKEGVLKSVKFVDDNSYDPTLLTRGKFDALEAFQSNEPLTLKADHAKFNEFTPQKLGLSGTVGVTVVNGTYLTEHRQAIADFVRADLHAFDYCLANANKCADDEEAAAKASGSTYAYAHELERWKIESGIAKSATLSGHGIGVETQAEWRPEDQALVTYKLTKTVPSLAKYEDTTLAASLYHGTKLIWP